MSAIRDELEVVVEPDGQISAQALAPLGVEPGEHLRVLRPPQEIIGGNRVEPPVSEDQSVLEVAFRDKRPPFKSLAGSLQGVAPDLTWDDFVAASDLAIADLDAGSTSDPP